MKKQLYRYAFITSPIIAIYGVSPLIIFNKLLIPSAFSICFGLTINTFIFWAINIYLIQKIDNHNKWKIYGMSYSIGLIFQVPRIFFKDTFPLDDEVFRVIENFVLYPIITTLAINTIILIICNSVLISDKQKKSEIEIEQLKVEKLEAQKQVLMKQLQPHFLFNSLSVLKSLIQDNTEDAEDYTVKLSEFLRYSVESHQKELVKLSEELQFTKDYLELQKVRFEDSFKCSIEIPEEKYLMKIPVYALQTLVENAFKHNCFTEKNPLTISIRHENNHLKIENNKVAIKVAENTSTGLNNLNKRYELIAGKHIEVKENDKIFSVTIPLI